jgi:hypothetical protein
LDVYGSRCDQAANVLPLNASYTLGRLLSKELAAGDTLISFNYDTLAERLATRFGHTLRLAGSLSDLDLSFDPPGILFAKPHGSASWAMHLSTNTITWSNDYSPILDSLSAADVDSGREPLVLGAVPIKSELLWQVQAYPSPNGKSWSDIFTVVVTQWRRVLSAIRDADVIVLVGYSLPPEDQYGRFLVREALRLRGRKVRIEFFELDRMASLRAKEIMDAFSGYVDHLHFRGPVEPP